MGLTSITLEVGNVADPEHTINVLCLVDSGAIYSVIPRAILESLGIKPIARETYRLADGQEIQRDKGVALFSYDGRRGGADVIFGEQDDATLLGAFTLEALGLALDPLRRVLKPLPLLLM